MSHFKKALVRQKECVACGCCVPVCPKSAITVWNGVCAQVDESACIGCGKCMNACPAGVIQVEAAP